MDEGISRAHHSVTEDCREAPSQGFQASGPRPARPPCPGKGREEEEGEGGSERAAVCPLIALPQGCAVAMNRLLQETRSPRRAGVKRTCPAWRTPAHRQPPSRPANWQEDFSVIIRRF